MRFNTNNDLLLGTKSNGKICLFAGQELSLVQKFDHYDQVSDGDISASGKYIITTGSNKRMCLWDAQDGQLIKEFEATAFEAITSDLYFGRFIDDNSLLAPYSEEIFAIYSVPELEPVKFFKGHKSCVSDIGIFKEKDLIVSTDEVGCIYFWMISTGVNIAIIGNQFKGNMLFNPICLSDQYAMVSSSSYSKKWENDSIHISKLSDNAIKWLELLKNGYLNLDQILFLIFSSLISMSSKLSCLDQLPSNLKEDLILIYNSFNDSQKNLLRSNYLFIELIASKG